MRLTVHNLYTRSTEILEGSAESIEGQLVLRFPELAAHVDPDEGLDELLAWLNHSVQGVEFELEPFESMSKAQTPPTFPKLGVGDNRRETPYVETHQALQQKQMSTRLQGLQDNRSLNADERQYYGKQIKQQVRAANPFEAGRGAVSAAPGYRAGYVRAGPIASSFDDANRSSVGTKQHEDFHQVMKRVEEKHGYSARRFLAQNLLRAIPTQYRNALEDYQRHMTGPIYGNSDIQHEEKLARLHNYLNSPDDRFRYHSENGHDAEHQREFGTRMKRAYQAMRAASETAHEGWFKSGAVIKSEESLEKVSLTPESTSRQMRPHEPRGYETYDRVETYKVGPDMWHHVFYGQKIGPGYRPLMHTLTTAEHPLNGTLYASASAGLHDVEHHKKDEWSQNRAGNIPWGDGHFAMQGEVVSTAPGKGWGTILYENMAKVHGRLASDSSVSAGAQGVWQKLMRNPEFKGQLGPDKGHVHWVEHLGKKPEPTKVIEGDGRKLESQLAQPKHQYRVETKLFSLKKPDDYLEAQVFHGDERVGVRGLHLDHENKRIYQQPNFRGGVHHFSHMHPDASGISMHHVQKQTGYTNGGDLPYEETVKKSEQPDNLLQDDQYEAIQDMLGFAPHAHSAFAAARFLTGAEPAALDVMRRSLWQHDGDVEAAALSSYGMEASDQNRKALRAVQKYETLGKFEARNVSVVAPGTPDAEPAAREIQEAVSGGKVEHVKLGGRHSAGSLLIRGQERIYLMKPGSGGQSPAAGAQQEDASQSRREAAFWHVAQSWGLADDIPRADLLVLDGHEFAAIQMLPFDWRNAAKVAVQDHNRVLHALARYRQSGLLHQWAILDFVLGNPDRHGQNVMVGPGNELKLIDHGSAFAGPGFDPAHDQNSFVPFYLRAWVSPGRFNKMTTAEKLGTMPTVNHEIRDMLRRWVAGLDAAWLTAVLQRYDIDPGPSLQRLQRVKALTGDLDSAINRLWVTV